MHLFRNEPEVIPGQNFQIEETPSSSMKIEVLIDDEWCLGLEKGGDLPISNQAVYPSLFVNMVLAAQIDWI